METKKWGDVRDVTHQTRVKIGFVKLRDEWKNAPANFTDKKLEIRGHPVMENWEDNYMKDLAQIAASRGGRVLEVGFGLGISATYLQKANLLEHVIIEANRDVADLARKFGSTAPIKTTVLEGFWEDVTASLPNESFEGILFDTYPLCSSEIHKNHFAFFETARRLLKPGGVLTYYSDEIENFSTEHRLRLAAAGFGRIKGRVCRVNPPPDCQYWKSKTILSPIIIK